LFQNIKQSYLRNKTKVDINQNIVGPWTTDGISEQTIAVIRAKFIASSCIQLNEVIPNTGYIAVQHIITVDIGLGGHLKLQVISEGPGR